MQPYKLPQVSSSLFTLLMLMLIVSFYAHSARADGGELSLHFMSGHEMARLRHPSNSFTKSPAGWAYVPRLGLHAEYGTTHAWHIGLGAEYSFSREASFVGGMPLIGGQGELIANTQSFFMPVTVGYHLARGSDWSATIRAYAGLSVVSWDDRVLYRSGPQISAQTQRLPLDAGMRWVQNWQGRLNAVVDWRPNAHFRASAGPYVTGGLQGDLALGLALQTRLQWRVGPYL